MSDGQGRGGLEEEGEKKEAFPSFSEFQFHSFLYQPDLTFPLPDSVIGSSPQSCHLFLSLPPYPILSLASSSSGSASGGARAHTHPNAREETTVDLFSSSSSSIPLFPFLSRVAHQFRRVCVRCPSRSQRKSPDLLPFTHPPTHPPVVRVPIDERWPPSPRAPLSGRAIVPSSCTTPRRSPTRTPSSRGTSGSSSTSSPSSTRLPRSSSHHPIHHPPLPHHPPQRLQGDPMAASCPPTRLCSSCPTSSTSTITTTPAGTTATRTRAAMGPVGATEGGESITVREEEESTRRCSEHKGKTGSEGLYMSPTLINLSLKSNWLHCLPAVDKCLIAVFAETPIQCFDLLSLSFLMSEVQERH